MKVARFTPTQIINALKKVEADRQMKGSNANMRFWR